MPIVYNGNQEFHLQHSEEEKLNQFQTITSFPEDELPLIIKLLQNHSWHLEPALSRYFDGDWKENLNATAGPSRAEEDDFTHITPNMATQHVVPFLAADRNFIPSLPIVSRLPQDYKEKFQIVGLQSNRSSLDTNPILLVVMLLPSLIVKLGVDIFSFIWNLISFGFGDNNANGVQKFTRFPSKIQEPVRPVSDDITAVLGPESNELLTLASKLSFNELWEDCERKFKFMLIIFLGNLVGEDSDLGSQRFLKNIIADESTISYFNENKQNLEIYFGSSHDRETWYVGKHLDVRYTPECYLVANVLNANGSFNGATRMSLLGKIRLTSLRRFQRSLRMHMDKYSAELIISRNEREELELARKLKESQDQAFEESLRQDQIKEEKRRIEAEQLKLAKLLEEETEYRRKIQATARNLFWLNTTVTNLDCRSTNHEKDDKQAVLQIRTSDGKRIIKKFPGRTNLRQLYLDVGCHLYLQETSNDATEIQSKLVELINSLAADSSVLCFKDSCEMNLNTIEEIKATINEELTKLDDIDKPGNLQIAEYIDFELVSPFPRFKIPFDDELLIQDISKIWPNGSLLVEYVEQEQLDSLSDD
ncbi:Ubx2p Ecym_4078 [Eremothecium cymbalariae DBVPG|uniref:UBX domain-containing protein n=1 Tax=Eremothecium cymbalariae (strain CBS 270.75 / DBVPG 7215 / KCTC 17166 / NRRL Y-17582) TaxID=931890 RepID=G8JT05_ERECY|nr:hypothetical protein Ecym_4078 [Eremothecium cymbalariae DBVPG\